MSYKIKTAISKSNGKASYLLQKRSFLIFWTTIFIYDNGVDAKSALATLKGNLDIINKPKIKEPVSPFVFDAPKKAKEIDLKAPRQNSKSPIYLNKPRGRLNRRGISNSLFATIKELYKSEVEYSRDRLIEDLQHTTNFIYTPLQISSAISYLIRAEYLSYTPQGSK